MIKDPTTPQTRHYISLWRNNDNDFIAYWGPEAK